MAQTEVTKLLRHVAGRQHAVSLARCFYMSVLVLAGVYVALLLVSRFLALIPDVFEFRTLLAIPVAATLVALVATRRGAAPAAARQIDTRMDTKDLFLTTALIAESPGEYKPLVLRDAVDKAQSIRPSTVVPFDCWSKVFNVTVIAAVLLAGVAFKFQLDPFGKEQIRKDKADRAERLVKTKEATAARARTLEKKDLKAEHSDQIAAALAALKQDLNLMKPKDQAGNLRKLQAQKADIGKMWKDLSQKKLSDALNSKSTAKRFGAMETAKTKQWKEQMAAGNTAGISKELSELKDLAQQLAQTPEGKKKDELKKELDKRLTELADFASDKGSTELSDALSRAMQQLDMASMEGLSQDAMQGLAESLDLSSLELESLAQSLRDLQSLEQALKAMQMAQMLNSEDGLDGQACGSCNSMADYAALYAQLMAQGQGAGGTGPGMGGPGRGKGNVAPEDDTLQTAHKTEKSSSSLTAGKILMQWKTNEVAESGEIERDFTEAIDQLKHDVSEAIVHEEVPPGLHDTIRKYFDTIDQTVDKSGQE